MKKNIKIVLILVICLLCFPIVASAATGIKITYNGKTTTYKDKVLNTSLNGTKIDISKTPGILVDGYAMLPYKPVFVDSKIHATSSYSSTKDTIKLTYKDKVILMTLGKKTATVNGVAKTMPVAPRKVTYVSSGKTTILVPSRFIADTFGLTYNWNSKTTTVELVKKGIDLKYDSKWYTYTGKQLKITTKGNAVATNMPGIIIENTELVPANSVFKVGVGASYSYNSDSKVITIKRYRKTVKLTLGSNIASVNGVNKTMDTNARLVYLNEKGSWYVMVPASFVAKSLGLKYSFDTTTNTCIIKEPSSFGSIASLTNKSSTELRAMWISYLEFGTTAKTKEQFETMIDTMYDNCVSYGMNAVVVQVRPFADALYPSNYFPWSAYVSGEQGKSVDYDPLKYMVSAAHDRGLEFHAWINPYRVSLSSDYSKLSDDNIAKVWHESEDKNRNVLSYSNKLYFNPAIPEVRSLIVNGVKELVKNYNIDGIHMDDYFYPTFSKDNVSSTFDATEYKAYVEENKENGVESLSIADWRRKNVTTLVKKIYSSIKTIDPGVAFGIAPAANLSNLRSTLQHYVDIDTWVSKAAYVDYLCPQIYWGFDYGAYSYDKVMDQWAELNADKIIKLYSGLAVYKAGTSESAEWKNDDEILMKQVEYSREDNKVNGFMFFRYEHFLKTYTQNAINNMLSLWQ
ncbi:family 10 glycosylhydrolase [Anaeromicropila herbilytica]|uniref:Glycosyl hydrolase-like 10 domain-containing protein n=1 Tax=Anaeromicropila herbilytica TaxID=2785025 RepID=A0A7R7EKA4_9FIRM|nr:family 10 glycosylhydrolase [Anaeromicropila herbilytica]BCN30328.1 hypothetical protein bsdtb5_16230 [Anaeromicropila herbilytica]